MGRDSTASGESTVGGESTAAGSWYVYRCQLRWADFDAYRHVNNVRFLELFQDARIDFANALLPDPQRLEAATVVARQEVDYLLPLHYRPGTVDVPIWVTRIGGSSATVAFEVVDSAAVGSGLQPAPRTSALAPPGPGAGPAARRTSRSGGDRVAVYARGSCVVVGYDLPAGRSRRFSDAEREVFAAIAEPGATEPEATDCGGIGPGATDCGGIGPG